MRLAVRVSLIVVAGMLGLAGVALAYSVYEEATLPVLVRDMQGSFAETNMAFDERVKARFPIGMDAQDVIDALRSDGFEIAPDKQTAHFDRPTLVCRFNWRVLWTADESGAVNRIDGMYSSACL